jgi:pSer/pThr/pTyr-binding forkhead associated (FHA) protein
MVTTVGRHPDNGLVIDDDSVSSHHAEIREQGGHFFLRDLGSTNGTFVNRNRITLSEIHVGDLVHFGVVRKYFDGQTLVDVQPSLPSEVLPQVPETRTETKRRRPIAYAAGIAALIAAVTIWANSETVEPVVEDISDVAAETGLPNWDRLARSVVFIEASGRCDWRGSGTLVLDGSYILTNQHVSLDGECDLRVGLTKSLDATPSGSYEATVLISDEVLDLAVLRLVDSAGNPLKIAGHEPVPISYGQPPLGSRLATLGYPALGSYDAGMTITLTSGTFSGIDYTDGEFFKTDAQLRGGVSGGAAFNERGQFIGVPTGVLLEEETGERVGINLIRPAKYAKDLLERARSGQSD